jgi:predicted HAD superfamily Cof-like phosphohydrolase
MVSGILPILKMKTEQDQVHLFMVKAHQATPPSPALPPIEVRLGRLKWLAEELCELANAWGVEIELDNHENTTHHFSGAPLPPEECLYPDPVEAIIEAYDASLDLIVFAVGNGVAMGTQLQPGWDEVISSNDTKFIDGHLREDGKWMKGPSYRPANLRPIIVAQIEQAKNQPNLSV